MEYRTVKVLNCNLGNANNNIEPQYQREKNS